MTSAELSADYAQCERIVRDADPDRAVSVQFAPADKRRHLHALYAFNIETARVRDQISQPLPGEIRLQWWRDMVAPSGDAGSGSAERVGASGDRGGGGHPVASALFDTIARFDLPPAAFERFLDARIFDLYDDPMPSVTAFEGYAGDTASALIVMAAMILDRSRAPQVSEAAGHAGVAQAAVGALRLLPIHRHRRQVFLPADLLDAAGCPAEALIAGDSEPTDRAISAMAAFARDHLGRYRMHRETVPRSLRAAFLPADMTQTYLRPIEAAGRAAIEQPPRIGPFRRTFTLWRAMRG
ncbi:phytoene synthase [Aureimonas sp. SA4125]|uniref:phytoene/squalene synthase family protein n=1 Tax=Aureimonas sp. SA4125 TaxID=2826993 RepID=UPI001CC61551|nr:phytoene/squalene synthase family protein [Aureimonas sp. SA4125]BDA84357.1 phytoene synthase [Aureimonas sp. SA4125]